MTIRLSTKIKEGSAVDPSQVVEDRTWIALTTSLASLTALLRYSAGENNINREEAMQQAADGIKAISAAMRDFSL